MKTLNAKKVLKAALFTAFALVMTACGKSGSSTSNPYGYNAYTSAYSGCTVAGCVSGSGTSGSAAIGMVRSVALQADIGLQFAQEGNGYVAVQGEMVVGSGGASCPIPAGTYSVTGQLQELSGASAAGYLQISGPSGTTEAYLNTYLEQRTVTSQYLGAANYLMANTIQLQICGPAFYFQVY